MENYEDYMKKRRQEMQSIEMPKAYTPRYDTQIGDVMGRIENRKPFTYDVNGDALYQQYKDQYTRGGRLAMQDTMGQAAALTGGYGNSYAATAGNQAYQAYLGQLNNVLPQLYSMANDSYNRETDDLYNLYGMYAADDQRQYGRWVDDYNRWMQAYQQGVSEDQWERKFAEDKRQFDATYDLKLDKQYGGDGVYQGATYSTGDFSNGWQGYAPIDDKDEDEPPTVQANIADVHNAGLVGEQEFNALQRQKRGNYNDYADYNDYYYKMIAKRQAEGKLSASEAADLLTAQGLDNYKPEEKKKTAGGAARATK